MDVMKTHGAFSWSELTTGDPAAAADFYSRLFGWTIRETGPEMGGYRVASIGSDGIAGIMAAPPQAQGGPPAWGVYVTVNNVDETLATARRLGATICMEPMDVPGVGRMAMFSDPQGATLSVIQYPES